MSFGFSDLREIFERIGPEFQDNACIAGGAVRDAFLGRTPRDIDIFFFGQVSLVRFANARGYSGGRPYLTLFLLAKHLSASPAWFVAGTRQKPAFMVGSGCQDTRRAAALGEDGFIRLGRDARDAKIFFPRGRIWQSSAQTNVLNHAPQRVR